MAFYNILYFFHKYKYVALEIFAFLLMTMGLDNGLIYMADGQMAAISLFEPSIAKLQHPIGSISNVILFLEHSLWVGFL